MSHYVKFSAIVSIFSSSFKGYKEEKYRVALKDFLNLFILNYSNITQSQNRMQSIAVTKEV